MSKFKDGLQHNISIYVPSTIGVCTPTENTDILKDVVSDLTILVGGCTTYHARGSYLSTMQNIIDEDIIIVSANVKTLTDALLNKVYAIAERIRERMSQESVAVMIDGILYFV